MLPRLLRMSRGDMRYMFRQKHKKIHATHLSARVFFLPEQPASPRFGILLPRGSYSNSPDMHRRRRHVYAALSSHLTSEMKNIQQDGLFCAIQPKETFFHLPFSERIQAVHQLFDLPPLCTYFASSNSVATGSLSSTALDS